MKIFPRLLGMLVLTSAVVLAAAVPKVTPQEATQRVTEGKAVLVDVREPAEWAKTGVAAPAILLPMSDFKGKQKLWKVFLENNRGKEIILYCRTGHRAGLVAKKLAEQGRQVANAGGFSDWKSAGLPTRKP